ncbi:HS12B-like protein, partial [Mya arenaria]
PTCALIKPDGKTLHAFGFDAETKYSDLLEEDNDEGGTIDVTAHEVVGKGRVKELYKASGGAWGGTKVDDAFLDFLTLVTGPDVIDSFKKSNLYDYNDMMKRFEMKKRSITHESESKVVMSLPLSLLTTVKQKTGKEVAETAALSKFGKESTI